MSSNTLNRPKKAPFMLFMQYRKSQLVAEGSLSPEAEWKQVAEIVTVEWETMRHEEKEMWKQRSQESTQGSDRGYRKTQYRQNYPYPRREYNRDSDPGLMAPSHNNRSRVSTTEGNRVNHGAPSLTGMISSSSMLYVSPTALRRMRSIFLDYDKEKITGELRKHFHTVVENKDDFLQCQFPFVHFNYYSAGDGLAYIPAEFAVGGWSILKGMEVIQGGPIDPGEAPRIQEMWEQSDRLSLPKVPYTYTAGVTYSAGEDRYDEILKDIEVQAMTVQNDYESNMKYVFTATEYLEVAAGCISWLADKVGKQESDLNIRVFPIESFIAELLRACILVKDLDLKKSDQNPISEYYDSDYIAPENTNNESESEGNAGEQSSLSSIDEESVQLQARASESYAKNKIVTTPFWNTRLKLGCHLHKTVEFSNGILSCSTMFVKKWSYLTICEAAKILGREFWPLVQEMKDTDMYPLSWDKHNAIAIEARQRFGRFGEISAKRREILEDDFVFPDFLNLIKDKFPNGLIQKPKEIIWPLERSIEDDLNYSSAAVLSGLWITDENREERAKRLEDKRLKTQNTKKTLDDWW